MAWWMKNLFMCEGLMGGGTWLKANFTIDIIKWMAGWDPIGMKFFAWDFQLNYDPLRLKFFMLAPNVYFLGALAMCSSVFYIQSYIMFFEVTSKTLIINPNGRYLKHNINQNPQSFIAFQAHMSVVFHSDIFPSVSWGSVQFQWKLGRWVTLRNFTRLRFSPNLLKFGASYAKWNSLILIEISPPSKKIQRSHSKQNTGKKLIHFGSLRDLGVKRINIQWLLQTLLGETLFLGQGCHRISRLWSIAQKPVISIVGFVMSTNWST